MRPWTAPGSWRRPCRRRPRRCRSPQSTRPPRGRRTPFPYDRDSHVSPSWLRPERRRRQVSDPARLREAEDPGVESEANASLARRYHTGCRCGSSWTTARRFVPAPGSANTCTSSCGPTPRRAPPTSVTVFTSSWTDRVAPGTAETLRARVVDRRVPVAVLNYLWHRARVAARRDGWPARPTSSTPRTRCSSRPRDAARVVTVHDLFFLSHPERTTAEIRRDYAALAAAHARRADAVIAVVAVHAAAGHRAARRGRRSRARLLRRARRTWARLGQAPNVPAGGLRAVPRHARAAQEPRRAARRLRTAGGARRSGAAAADRRRAGPGAEPWLDRIRRPPLDGGVRYVGYVPDDDAGSALCRRPHPACCRRSTKGSGCRRSRRCRPAIPVVASNARRAARSGRRRGRALQPRRSGRPGATPSARLADRRRVGARARAPPGWRARGPSSWDVGARAGRIYDEAVARRRAAGRGRRRARQLMRIAIDARELAGARPASAATSRSCCAPGTTWPAPARTSSCCAPPVASSRRRSAPHLRVTAPPRRAADRGGNSARCRGWFAQRAPTCCSRPAYSGPLFSGPCRWS